MDDVTDLLMGQLVKLRQYSEMSTTKEEFLQINAAICHTIQAFYCFKNATVCFPQSYTPVIPKS